MYLEPREENFVKVLAIFICVTSTILSGHPEQCKHQ